MYLSIATLALALQTTMAFKEHKRSALSRAKYSALTLKTPAKPASRPLVLSTTSNTFELSKSLKQSNIAARSDTLTEYAEDEAAEYAINIEFAGKNFSVIFDTGSSDLWLAQKGFACVDENEQEVDESECNFGPLYDGQFSSNETISNEILEIGYGDGEVVEGPLGYVSVTLGNITVPKQEAALIQEAYFQGDGVTSGLMGFAYPSITSAYEESGGEGEEEGEGQDEGEGQGEGGEDGGSYGPAGGYGPNSGYGPDSGYGPGGFGKSRKRQESDEDLTQVYYNNWIFNAIDQGLTEPMFSLALSRGVLNGTSGSLAIGGLPSDVDWDGEFVTTPIEIANLENDTITATNYSFYTIQPDGFYLTAATENATKNFISWEKATVKASTSSGRYKRSTKIDYPDPVIVDSGTTLIYLNEAVTKEINQAFDPAARYDSEEEVWLSKSDATPPTLSVSINGTEFPIDAADLLPTDLGKADGDYYLTGVQYEEDVYILGDLFLHNVVAVFDIGSSQMKFAARKAY